MANFNGFVALHRSLLDWEWHSDPATGWLFVNLILLANHSPAEWKGIKIDRGQLITGRKALAEQTGLSEQSIRTAIKHLKATGEVTITSTSKFSLITVVNYGKFQDFSKASTSDLTGNTTSNQPAANQQLATNNKENKENKENNVCVADAPTTKCVEQFIPPTVEEVRQYCEERDNGIDPYKFVYYNESRGWMMGTSKIQDWKAAVRCWERNEL